MGPPWSVLAAAFTLGVAAAAPPVLQDSGKKMPEYELKAGFLYNFAKYVEWPADAFEKAETPITIAIVGTDPFGQVLEKTLKDRQAQDRKFSIVRYRDVGELKPCHILFIPKTEKTRADILKKVQGWPTLTVGEAEGFAQSGGAVNILIEKERPRLEINQEVAEKAKLTIQARLLKLATLVKTEK
jgi:hypothetical protein